MFTIKREDGTRVFIIEEHIVSVVQEEKQITVQMKMGMLWFNDNTVGGNYHAGTYQDGLDLMEQIASGV
jgi:hypothetical protein